MSARIDRREYLLLIVFSAAVAAALTWPLSIDLGSRLPNTLVDPSFKVWEIGWIGHALREQPLHLYDANVYWPHAQTLAFSDAMVGTGIFTWPADGFRASLIEYNVLFVLAFALAVAGAYLLARELGAPPAGAVVAGVAFAYAPWRFGHASHMHVLMSGGIPLSLFLLLHGYRSASGRVVAAGWLVAVWQLTLGFTLGLQLAYLLIVVAVATGVFVVVRRQPIPRRIVGVTLGGAAAFALIAAVLAQPYLDVAERHPQAKRTPREISALSPVPQSVLSAPEPNLIWGPLTSRVRDTLRAPDEQSLFPGLATFVLALIGLRGSTFPRWSRIALGGGVVVTGLLALGMHVSLGRLSWLLPYRLLFEFAPGWEGLRTPGRIFTLTSLALALLAGAGAAVLARRVSRPAVALAFVAAVVLLEGYARIPYPEVPNVPRNQVGLPGPQLHLPTDAQQDALYMLWSTEGFPELVNGYPGFTLPQLDEIRAVAREFPAPDAVETLRAAGIRVVVLHPDLARGTPWEHLDEGGPAPPQVLVEHRGDIVVYHLR